MRDGRLDKTGAIADTSNRSDKYTQHGRPALFRNYSSTTITTFSSYTNTYSNTSTLLAMSEQLPLKVRLILCKIFFVPLFNFWQRVLVTGGAGYIGMSRG